MQLKFDEGQTIITMDGIRQQSKLSRLRLLRETYYTQLLHELETLCIRRKQCIESFKNVVKELDAEIVHEEKKHNPKFKELQSIGNKLWR